jgi:Asp-tRNA(Asn)/Glu-tRNA(Gln) amidotransferase A subunit family amidase
MQKEKSMQQDICKWSMMALHAALDGGDVSALETVQACLKKVASENDVLRTFVSVSQEARNEAHNADQRQATVRGTNGALWGVPIAVKDVIDVRGMRTTAASRVLEGETPAANDAPCVQRLRQAGAIVLGKTNLHEFAYGVTGTVSAYGAARNPLDRTRVCGGSSSGSAAALAAGMCFGALGTDTAGSIRLPAACCGVVGFKPTWGAVPVAGVIPLAWSYDHVGPMARTVADVGVLFSVLTGEAPQWRLPRETQRAPLICGVGRKYFCEGLAPEVAAGFERALDAARALGWSLREVEISPRGAPSDSLGFHDKWINAESWAYHNKWMESRSSLYAPGTLLRARSGEQVSFEEYVEARRGLELLRERSREGVAGVDVLLTPTSPILPPFLEEVMDQSAQALKIELQMLRNTSPFDVLGWPTVTVPCAPMVGAQISAGRGKDWLVLSTARELAGALSR